MTREGLEFILGEVATWPEEAQDELLQSMAEIKARHFGADQLSDEERAAIDRGLADANTGRFA
jgi:predicted transcriptional regulator